MINADHVSIEDYHVAINADHVAIDACHVVINAGQTHHIFSAQAYRSGTNSIRLSSRRPKRKQAEQRKLLENSMAIRTGYPVSERSAAKGATRQQLLHAYMMPSLCY